MSMEIKRITISCSFTQEDKTVSWTVSYDTLDEADNENKEEKDGEKNEE